MTADARSAALLRAALALSEEHDLEDVLRLIVTSARSLAGAPYAALAVYDAEGSIEAFVHDGIDAGAVAAVGPPPRGHGVLGDVIVAHGAIRLGDVTTYEGFAGFPPQHPLIGAFVGVPIATTRRRYGNLYVGADPGAGVFDDEDEQVLGTLAAFAAAAIENVQLLATERDLATARERERFQEAILGEVIDAQESERARVARDLHDEIGQSLTSVLLGLRLVEDSLAGDEPDLADARRRTAEVRDLVVDALSQARTLAFDLRPTVLDDLGLVAALRRLAHDLDARRPPAVDLEIHGVDDDVRLPRAVETVVYRIVQEALTNVVRHAGAASASVVVARERDRVRAVIEDDGSGFDPANVASASFGLGGMKERATLVGGTLEVDAAPGRGVTVRLEVPLV